MTASTTRVLLRAERLCKSYGSLRAVDDVSLDIREGEIHAVIGPNGAGKTTLLNVLSGELLPTSGSLVLEGRDVTGWTPDRLARAGLGRSFQHSSIFESLSVFENVRLATQLQLATSMHFFKPAVALRPRQFTRARNPRGLRIAVVCQYARWRDQSWRTAAA